MAFSENVKRIMDARYDRSPNKPKSLAADAGVSFSTIQRAISGEFAPTLDTVEAIANALRVDPASLLREPSPQERKRTGTHN